MVACAANASTLFLQFVWDYDADATLLIDGFYLYEDEQRVDLQIVPTDRTVQVPYIKDMQERQYYLTAFMGEEESGRSDVVTVPAHFATIPKVLTGSLKAKIVDQDGNVIWEIGGTMQLPPGQ
jgi:hypothetical protein